MKLLTGNRLKFLVIAIFLLSGLILSAAQDSEDSRLRVVHMSPGASEVGVFINGERTTPAIGFGGSTGYISLGSGSHTVELVSGDETLVTRQVELEEGSHTLVLRDMGFQPGTTLLRDRRTAVTGDSSRVRIAHFSPDVLGLDVSMSDGGILNVNDLSYREASGYQRMASGTYTIFVEDSSTGEELLEQEVQIRSGRSYTFFLSGLLRQDPGFRARTGTVSQAPVDDEDDSVEPEDEEGNGEDDGGTTGDQDGDIGRWMTIEQRGFAVQCRVIETPEE